MSLITINRLSDSSSSSCDQEQIVSTLDPSRKKEMDQVLNILADEKTQTIWFQEQDQSAAEKTTKQLKKIHVKKEKLAVASGLLAAASSACGCIPFAGGAVGAPFGFLANYLGTKVGIDL